MLSEYLNLYNDSYTFVWWMRASTAMAVDEGVQRFVLAMRAWCARLCLDMRAAPRIVLLTYCFAPQPRSTDELGCR